MASTDSIDFSINFESAEAQRALAQLGDAITGLGPTSERSLGVAGAAVTLLERELARLAKAEALSSLRMEFERSGKAADAAAAAAARFAMAEGEQAIAADKAANAAHKAAEEVKREAEEKAKNASETDALARKLDGLAGAFKQVAMAAAAKEVLGAFKNEIVQVAEQLENLQSTMAKLKFVNGGDINAAKDEFGFIIALADKLGLSLSDVSDAYSKFRVAATQAGLSADQVKQTFIGVTESSKAMGLSAHQAHLVMYALTEIASEQRVQLRHLQRQMAMQDPLIMDAASKAFNMSVKQMRDGMKGAEADIKDFMPAFAYQLREVSEKILPDAAASFESEFNRMQNALAELRMQAASGELGVAMTKAVHEMTEALRSPQIKQAYESIMGGFADVVQYFSFSTPAVADIFNKMGLYLGAQFANIFERIELLFGGMLDKLRSKTWGFAASMNDTLGKGTLTSWMVGGSEAAQKRQGGLDARSRVAGQAADTKLAELALLEKQNQQQYEQAAAAMMLKSMQKAAPGAIPDKGDKPPAAKLIPNKDKKDGMDSALKSYENAELQAAMHERKALRQQEQADLDADLTKKLVSEEDYRKKKRDIDLAAIDDEIEYQRKFIAERKAALAKANGEAAGAKTPAGQAARTADAKRIEGELLKAESAIKVFETQKGIVRLKFDGDSFKDKEAIDKLLNELDASIKELTGDKFESERMVIRFKLKLDLADPKNIGNPQVLEKLNQQATAKLAKVDYDEADKNFSRAKRDLEMTIQENDDRVKRGEITQIAAEENILAARKKVSEELAKQVKLVQKLAEATGDKDAIQAAKALGLELGNLTDTTSKFGLELRDGFIADMKQGFTDLIQKGEKLSDVLKKIAAKSLQKVADRLFDKGVNSVFEGFGKATAAGKDGNTAEYFSSLGKSMGSTFLESVNDGWGMLKKLASTLFDGDTFKNLFSSASGFLSGLFNSGGSAAGAAGGAAASGGLWSSIGSLFTNMAVGGSIHSNSAYIVGERGPEAFFPGMPGSMVPTDRLQTAMGNLLGVGAGSMSLPASNMAAGMGTVGGGSTSVDNHIHLRPNVTVSSSQIIEALRQDPDYERMHTKMTIANGKKIQSAW